jgi:riboflavin kinase
VIEVTNNDIEVINDEAFTMEVLNLTDFSFSKYCYAEYGINRGVYNTIESWFYEIGLTDIVIRRKEIIGFLEYVTNETNLKKETKIKFGNGGLSENLKTYWGKIPSHNFKSNLELNIEYLQ